LQADLLETRERTVRAEPQHVTGEFIEQPREHLTDKRREAGLGQLIVERLVPHRALTQAVEGAVDIRDRAEASAAKRLPQRQHPSVGRRFALAPAQPRRFAQRVQLFLSKLVLNCRTIVLAFICPTRYLQIVNSIAVELVI